MFINIGFHVGIRPFCPLRNLLGRQSLASERLRQQPGICTSRSAHALKGEGETVDLLECMGKAVSMYRRSGADERSIDVEEEKGRVRTSGAHMPGYAPRRRRRHPRSPRSLPAAVAA